MITDPQHPLVRALGQVPAGVDTVYLPTKVSDQNGSAAQTEAVAARPDVGAIAAAYFDDPDRLQGDRVPETTIMTERPVHRMMIYLNAQGASPKEIANQTGYSYASVTQLLRQPWARQRLLQILKETGQDAVKHFLTNEISPSLEVLRAVRDDGTEKGATRVIAADKILDRALGKATVHVESNSTILSGKIPDEVARIDAELKSVRGQLAQKGFPTDVDTSN